VPAPHKKFSRALCANSQWATAQCARDREADSANSPPGIYKKELPDKG
jgi:hypothetical protein